MDKSSKRTRNQRYGFPTDSQSLVGTVESRFFSSFLWWKEAETMRFGGKRTGLKKHMLIYICDSMIYVVIYDPIEMQMIWMIYDFSIENSLVMWPSYKVAPPQVWIIIPWETVPYIIALPTKIMMRTLLLEDLPTWRGHFGGKCW